MNGPKRPYPRSAKYFIRKVVQKVKPLETAKKVKKLLKRKCSSSSLVKDSQEVCNIVRSKTSNGPFIFYTSDLNDWGVKYFNLELHTIVNDFKAQNYLYLGPKWIDRAHSDSPETLYPLKLYHEDSDTHLIGYLWASLDARGRDAVAALFVKAGEQTGDKDPYDVLLENILAMELYPSMHDSPLAKRGYYDLSYGGASWEVIFDGDWKKINAERLMSIKGRVSSTPISLKLERKNQQPMQPKRGHK